VTARRTDHRDLRQRLRDSEYRYATLFNAIPACFWEIDFGGAGAILHGVDPAARHAWLVDAGHVRALLRAARVVDCNQRAVDVFGRAPDAKAELLTTIEPFWPEASYPVFARAVAAFLDGQASFSDETTMTTIAGDPRDVLFTACFPQDARADATMLIGIVDLSETRRALHDLRQANIRAETLREAQAFAYWQLDASQTNAMMADLRAQGVTDLAAYMDDHPEFVDAALDATIVTDINQKSLDLYGLTDKAQVIGKGIRSYWLPGRYEAFKGSIAAGFNGIAQFQMVTQTCTIDGRVLDCRFWMAAPPEMRAHGTVMVAIQDLTEDNARAREIAQLREGLAHAGRVLMLGEFTASIAHEINQPLAAVRAAASAAQRWLALDPPDLDQARASLAHIAQSASRAGQIIDRIRGMAVKRQPLRTQVDIPTLVDETIDFIGRELQAAGAAIQVTMPRDLPRMQIDRTQIQQVLVNLIINALQAMEQADSPRRRIALTVDDEGAGTVCFAVRDHGPGLDPATIDRLFDHFFTTKDGGMGIGLTICQSIVQAHGGTITARNVPGGAEFRFSLNGST
jgi:signal transduction histidine kinase